MLVFEERSCLIYRQEIEGEKLYRIPLLLSKQQQKTLLLELCTSNDYFSSPPPRPSDNSDNTVEFTKLYHTITNNCCRPLSLAIQKASGISYSNVWVVLRGLEDVLVSFKLIPETARSDRERFLIRLPRDTQNGSKTILVVDQ